MAETQDEPDRGAHLQLLECIGLVGQLWPKANGAVCSKGCLQNAERQSDNGSICTNTGVLLRVPLVRPARLSGRDARFQMRPPDTAPRFEDRYTETCLAERLRACESSNSSSDHHNLSNPVGHAFSAT